MKQHRYRITVEHLVDAHDSLLPNRQPLQFEVGNHDNIFAIVDRVRERVDFDLASAAALAVGLKLFSEVMLENREHPLFQVFAPHFRDFMTTLKKGT